MATKAFGCKLDEELIIQVKMHAMLTRTLMRDIVDRALVEYLDNHADEAPSQRVINPPRKSVVNKVK